MLRQSKAIMGRCPTCRSVIFSGVDASVAGLTVIVDHYPVDLVAEARAVVDGRRSYIVDNGPRIYARNRWNYGRPARWPVHLAHDCAEGVQP